MRDNREHDEERYGRNKNKDEVVNKIKRRTDDFLVTSSITAKQQGKYLIGGIVDLDEIVAAAEKLIPEIISIYEKFEQRRFKGSTLEHSYILEHSF